MVGTSSNASRSQQKKRRRLQSNEREDAHNDVDLEQFDRQEGNIRVEEERDLAAQVAQFILLMQAKKGTVKEAEVKKILQKVTSVNAREEIMGHAVKHLKDLAGIEVSTVPSQWGGRLIVKDALNIERKNLELSSNSIILTEKAKSGLLAATLIFLFMGRNPKRESSVVTEASLREFLSGLGLVENSNFGDIKKLIGPSPSAEFVSRGWVAYDKSIDNNGVEIISYKWGPRAHLCVDPMAILELFCAVNGTEPRMWKDHYEAALNARRGEEAGNN